MDYHHRSTREPVSAGALRRDVVALQRRVEDVESTATRPVDKNGIDATKSANAIYRKRMRKMERRLDQQAQMIDQMQLMVEQLIRKGSTSCREQCCSLEHQ